MKTNAIGRPSINSELFLNMHLWGIVRNFLLSIRSVFQRSNKQNLSVLLTRRVGSLVLLALLLSHVLVWFPRLQLQVLAKDDLGYLVLFFNGILKILIVQISEADKPSWLGSAMLINNLAL